MRIPALRAAASSSTVKLRSGGLTAAVAGGPFLTVESLRHRGRELLLAPDQLPASYLVHGARAGITLLHPWANRLGGERYEFNGRGGDVAAAGARLGRDSGGLPIHGLASREGWTVERAGPAVAIAHLSADATEAFPFAHDVWVTIELVLGHQVVIETTLSAQDGEQDVPVAFGWHPYFRLRRGPGAELVLPDRHSLDLDRRGLPTGSAVPRAALRVELADHGIDHGFSAIDDGASFGFSDGESSIEVIHDFGFPHAQVFAPIDAGVISFEPMSAPADALRSGRGLSAARPAEPYSARFTVALR